MSLPATTSPHRKTGAIGLAAAGLLIGLGGMSHPRVDTSLEFEAGRAGMFESSMWTGSHLLTMAGYLVLAASIVVLLNAAGDGWSARLRTVAKVAAAAAGIAALESVPHTLAATQSGLADLHTAMQVVSTPLLGLSLAALAVVGTQSRGLDAGRVATVIAVIGGIAFALAGPAIAFTQDSAPSPLFSGAAGLAIWAVVAGTRTARRVARERPAAEGVAVGTLVQGS